MKTKALVLLHILCLLALGLLAFSGCSTPPTVRSVTRVKARPAPVLPPMPGGLKAKVAVSQARPVAVRGITPAGGYVPGSPPMEGPFPWDGVTMLVRVWSAPYHSITVFQREAVDGAKFEIASYSCGGATGEWLAFTIVSDYPMLVAQAHSTNCGAGLMPANAPEPTVGTGRKVKFSDGEYWVLELPKTGVARRFVLKKVPPPK